MDYEEIKELASGEGGKITDYLVLSPVNDPFYVGSPGQLQKAEWFNEIYNKMGRPTECHIRRVHYWLVSQDPPYKKPDGSEYKNTDRDWSFLTIAAKYARYAGLVSINNIIDRRNPAPVVNVSTWHNEVPSETKEGVDAEQIIDDIARNFFCWNPSNSQKYHLELWCEKSTMNDILEPIAKRFGANLVTGLGELSITAVQNLADRIEETRKSTRIFYISDFDPAGECMPVSVSRKMQFLLEKAGVRADVKLKQIMLTSDQCDDYNLPRTPIKETELRKKGFEDRHGRGATELDALEALHPGEMRKIIETELDKFFDRAAWNRVNEMNRDLRQHVRDFLEDKIGNVLEDMDLSEYDAMEAPEAKEKGPHADKWLFDTARDYFEQLEVFKRFKGVS